MSTPTFVVGTGRCGSTMLSNMLREHPNVLSLSEFFANVSDGGRATEVFTGERIDGIRFWSILSALPRLMGVGIASGVACDEWIYPFESTSARFSRRSGVPAILIGTLPHLTDKHDDLFDLLGAEVRTWPLAAIGEHYVRCFHWLSDHFGKRMWVERSGGGIAYVGALLATFPDARFIHIARDGRDAALSMQKHQAIRVYFVTQLIEQILGVNPLDSADRSRIDLLPPELLPFLPEHFDAGALAEYRVPLACCGQMWSLFVDLGIAQIGALPADRLLTMRYEDFFTDPKRQLDTFAAFLGEGYVDEDWSARCAATVRPPRSTWRDLPEEDARALTEACRPGFELLRAAGVEYEF